MFDFVSFGIICYITVDVVRLSNNGNTGILWNQEQPNKCCCHAPRPVPKKYKTSILILNITAGHRVHLPSHDLINYEESPWRIYLAATGISSLKWKSTVRAVFVCSALITHQSLVNVPAIDCRSF
jgi:hypothetical protein